jgi:TolB-like protein/Tfp pilus assembly protein PilF
MSFFDELKRRNVFRVGIAYVISAWVLLQFVDLVLDNIQAPEWVMKVFMLALAVGFPLAVFFAWAFEVTPEGIKKEKNVDRSQSITKKTGHKLDRSIIIVLLIALIYFALGNFKEAPSIPETAHEPLPAVTEQLATTEQEPISIAVLPFVNMSTDTDNEFFSDGIAEEILNVLASIPDLKVAARTSAFAYKGTNTKIAQIAEELGVNHVLEGSVRKAGNQVRVTAQLIKADDGFHLWSANYDRELTNIFAIQDEIASSIADALKVTLALESGSAGNLTGTNSIEAYEHYLKGTSLWHERTAISLHNAIKEFEAAASLDPQFAKAHAGLAISWQVISSYTNLSWESTRDKSIEAANMALSLDPDNVESLATLGSTAGFDYRFKEAFDYFERVIALNPSYPTVYQWYGMVLNLSGDVEAALVKFTKGWDLDPRSRVIGSNLGWQLYSLDRVEEATRIGEQVLSFAPDFPDGLSLMFHMKLLADECDAARLYGDRLAAALNKERNSTQLYIDLCQDDDPALKAAAIETMMAWPELDYPNPAAATLSYAADLIIIFTEMEEIDLSLKLIEKNSGDDEMLGNLRSKKSNNMIRLNCDARFQSLVEQSGLPPSTHPVNCDES